MKLAHLVFLLSGASIAAGVDHDLSRNQRETERHYNATRKDQEHELKAAVAPNPDPLPKQDARCEYATYDVAQGCVYKVEMVDSGKDWHTWIPLILSGFAVVVGALAALATLAQARYFMSSQRAWLLISLNSEIKGEVLGDISVNGSKKYIFSIKNVGQTPARLVESSFRCIVLKTLDDLPAKPQYSSPTSYSRLLLVPSDSVGVIAELESSKALRDIELDILEGISVMYYYGYIKYLDTFGRERQTRAGFVLEAVSRAGRTSVLKVRQRGSESYLKVT